jgi:ATP-dependent DNA ligase
MWSVTMNASDVGLVYNVFDAMPLDEWVTQTSILDYASRTMLVGSVIDAVTNTSKVPYAVRQVPHIMAHDEEELKAYFAKCMDEGFEGVMLKTLNTSYVFKRSENILKLKPCVTYEGVIVGHYEGRHGTKREGLFGGFEVVLPNGIVTRLGGGFNDELKARVQLEGPDTYLGKVVELEAQPDPLTSDGLSKDGKARFPVFIRFRDDGDVDPKVIAAGKAYQRST